MAYDDFKKRIRDDWRDTLRSILGRARSVGPSALLAFDLDSTLFDNRPRQARILREYGAARSLDVLSACEPRHWVTGWDMKEAMKACGLEDALVEAHFPEARRFWAERFFTSDYCVDDIAIDGAARFTHDVVATGARLVYVTGRHEGMREGSVSCMRRHGLALPDDDRVLLLMKPTLAEDDDAFKREAHAQLGRLGSVVAAFDNEPTHANDYRRKFPEATVIHLATDHSGRPVELLDGVISVPHFALDS
ncbi:hypothetical protein [Comamonas sp. JC664]|uniref:hypothetical protein n=1 Tax=Comamonas sp. JC664 TaxID=2801917 RepID=UPI00174D6F73|nr:hypothetical protein [Comamonas sp. JC664]MBL0693691.1 hypothetical protein [Comamonas sp. JC664]GHG73873.1 hypothetical protein GCM10012319_21150 [Comamonas sp. KCTC 72670]